VIVHTAADTRWNQPPAEAWAANVDATAAVLALADRATHVIHVSTAFAVGLRGDTSSDRLADYRNTYEWSKAGAERLVARHARHTIVRPPLIIGRRSDGYVERFSGLYVLTRAWVAGLAPAIVGEPGSVVEIVPVDDVAAAVVAAIDAGPARDPIVLGAGPCALTTADVVAATTGAVNGWRQQHGACRLPDPPIISASRWERFFLPLARTTLSERQLRTVDLLGEFIPYLSMSRPPRPTALVPGVRAALGRAVRYWARTNPHAALAEPRPWTDGRAVMEQLA
jgi:nucleoside-diphosphate-sugar epimerase